MSKHNLWISPTGAIRTRETTVPAVDAKLVYVDGCTPMALTTVATDRRVLLALYNDSTCSIEPHSKTILWDALNKSQQSAPPIRVPTDYELMAWIDDVRMLEAVKVQPAEEMYVDEDGEAFPRDWPNLIPGKKYNFRRLVYHYRKPRQRKKVHSTNDGEVYTLIHDCELQGKDTGYAVRDEDGKDFVFRDNPHQMKGEFPSLKVWEFFERPAVETVAEVYDKVYKRNLAKLKEAELMNGFKFYSGQLDYIARLGCPDTVLGAGETGTGKTLVALALKMLKNCSHVVLIAPKGTVKDEAGNEVNYDPAQWVAEIKKFSQDSKVFTMFSRDDYQQILRENNDRLPPGIYVTYPQAYFTNGAFEAIPKSWKAKEREEKFRKIMQADGWPVFSVDGKFTVEYDSANPPNAENHLHTGIGQTQNGFTCIYKPSLSTLSKDKFKMVILDEAHLICNLDSQVTKAMLRMQPRYRVALTATPIPNIVYNIFPIIGWLAVDKWYQGEVSNPRWPYPHQGMRDFKKTFMSYERDYTEEAVRARHGGGGAVIKPSPIISQPQRLLKLLKGVLAFITKEECNPDVVDCEVKAVRIPMGAQQRKLYAHNLQIKNIPFRNPKTKYGVQLMRLRGITADPHGRNYNGKSEEGIESSNPMVRSNLNPKTLATLEKIGECLEKGEQVIHVAAFQGQNSEIADRLDEAGIKYSRIDATVRNHVREANAFKRGEVKVMLMGIKCAQAHSFVNCQNLIIGSLEWSYGSFNQAMGRIFRLNSPKDVNVFVILNKDSIEDLMFDKMADKRDAATICLYGEMVPSDFKSVGIDEIMADHIGTFDPNEDLNLPDESELEAEQWGKLKSRLAVQSDMKLDTTELSVA